VYGRHHASKGLSAYITPKYIPNVRLLRPRTTGEIVYILFRVYNTAGISKVIATNFKLFFREIGSRVKCLFGMYYRLTSKNT